MRPLALIEALSPIVMIFGALMLTVPLVDVLYGDSVSTWFILFGLIYFIAGFLSYKVVDWRYGLIELTLFESLIAYSIAWLIIPCLSAIPLSLELSISFDNALFESFSGFTGTGLTVLRQLDRVKHSVLLWRGLMQWTGELGVIVFCTVFLPFFWKFGHILYSIERPSRISASLRATAFKIFYMYFLVTVVGIIICIYLGVEPLDAVVHVMTAIATGGMSNYDANYEKVFQYAPMSIYPITALMIIGGFNFVSLSYILDGDLKEAWKIEEFRAYVHLTMLFSLSSFVLALPLTNLSISNSLLYGAFNAISALTTTGFSIGDVSIMPSSLKILLITAMFIGSMSYSTAGGIKVVRFIVLLRRFKTYILSLLSGGSITQDVILGEDVLDEREVSNIVLFILLHFIAVLTGASLLKSMIPEVDYLDALFEATSAASCVGLSAGLTSPNITLGAKITLIALMYFGRLEYTPLLVLLGLILYREYRILKHR